MMHSKTLTEILLETHSTISIAESCTGGYISKLLTDPPGASTYFLGGIIAYSNGVKEKILNVDSLKEHGAVSAETAAQMANNVKRLFKTSYSLSITGIAGPTGGSKEKPIGTFYIGLASTDTISIFKYLHEASRDEIRTYASNEALDILRRKILNIPYTNNAIQQEHRSNC